MSLHPNTFKFLSSLKKNNNRPWFEKHKPEYELIKKSFEESVDEIILLMSKFDKRIAGITAKDCVFRIYRDVRFSKDKSPYKPHLSAAIAPGGKKSAAPGYYVHVEPGGKNYLGGGVWQPEPAHLAKVRQEIDYNLKEYKSIISKPVFKKTFDDVYEDKLKKVPQGYDEKNPAIEFLKQKSFIYGTSLNDKIVSGKSFEKEVAAVFKTLYPFIAFLDRANQ